MARLYSDQSGNVGGETFFPIRRGVRQGDILSPALFNAALESVIRRWKTKLRNNGLLLDATEERLTNIRYADDLLIFAKSFDEAVFMLEILTEELANAGLSVNGSKTKILTTDGAATDNDAPLLADIAGSMVEILRCESTHKYLGRLFSGNLRRRGQCNLNHRLACGWLKFHKLSTSLMNRKIPIHLRLKLFHSVITPIICYSLTTTPLTATQLSRLDVVQRKMLREMVGWVRFDDEDWEITGQRMKARLEAALTRFPIPDWSMVRQNGVDRLLRNIESGSAPVVLQLTFRWDPRRNPEEIIAYRRRGRPLQRWME